MKKGVKSKKIYNNRLLYSLIAVGVLIAIAVGVYAANSLLTPGVAPNPGHTINQTAPPNPCSAGQVLEWNGTTNANGGWSCVDMSSSTDTRCDTSGTCSQVCIGTSCKSSWPQSLTKSSIALYTVNGACIPDCSGGTVIFTTSSTCSAKGVSSGGQTYYATCDCSSSTTTNPGTCPNNLLGYFVT